ncbi:MAG: DNA-3-methyladenine glycosylase 2 family protein, partial [Hyphomicrobiales bacterium]
MGSSSTSIERLDSAEVLTRHLKILLKQDKRLAEVSRKAGPFEIRLQPGGFAGLAKVICGQQLS